MIILKKKRDGKYNSIFPSTGIILNKYLRRRVAIVSCETVKILNMKGLSVPSNKRATNKTMYLQELENGGGLGSNLFPFHIRER